MIAMFIPLMEFNFSQQASQTVAVTLKTISVSTTAVEHTIQSKVTWSTSAILMSVYLLVCLLATTRFGLRMYRLIQIIRSSKVQVRTDHKLINTNGNLPTFSFMRYLFWDNTKELTPAERIKIINHELTHIRDLHSWDVMYMELVKIVFWFNPVVYFYDRSLKYHHEFIADAAVLKETSTKDYSKLLVQSLFKQANLHLAHDFNQTEIKRRLAVMEKLRTPGYKFLKVFLLLPLMALMLFAFSNGSPGAKFVAPVNENYRFANVEGGLDSFYEKMTKEIKYPIDAKRKGIEGRVFVQFKIMANGELSQFKILKGLSKACDTEAVRAIKAVPAKWLPAKMDGQKIGQKITIPVMFSLEQDK
jgi:TonB family protein